MSIEEIIKMAHNYGCLYESTLSEVYSEETLLKDLKKQLTIHVVSSGEAKLKFNEFANKQQDLDSEFVKIVNVNFWDLL